MDDDYCDFCDLPRSQCVHGRPPPEPAPAPTPVKKAAPAAPKPRKRSTARTTTTTPTGPSTRRWTPSEVFKPHIVAMLEEAGGELDAEDAFARLEVLLADQLRAGDHERTPEGELRWQYAARRARVALLAEGVMAKSAPGVWQLAGS